MLKDGLYCIIYLGNTKFYITNGVLKMAKFSFFKKKDPYEIDFYEPEGQVDVVEDFSSNTDIDTENNLYQEVDFDYQENKKKKISFSNFSFDFSNLNLKIIIPLVIFTLILMGAGIYAITYFSSVGTLEGMDIDNNNIIYLDEINTITVKALGEGNLRKTRFQYEVSDTTMVGLENSAELKGAKVSNNLIPITTGRFILLVSASLENQEITPVESEIIVCKKLKNGVLQTNQITMSVGMESEMNIDLGTEIECYEGLKYQVSDLTIATISENGTISAKNKGTTNLTVSRGADFVTAKITVTDDKIAVSSVTLNSASTTLEIGATQKLKATILPNNATDQNITWTSSNTKVLTVSNTGVIKGVSAGKATVTVTSKDGSHSATISVTVNKKVSSSSGSSSSGSSSSGSTSTTNKPTITSSRMYSNNATNTGYARSGERITVAVTFSESVNSPTIKIAGITASVSGSGKSYTASITVPASLGDGAVSVSISGYKNSAGTAGASSTSLTGGNQKTIIDNTAPKCTVAVSGKQVTITGVDKYGISGYVINQIYDTPTTGYTSTRVRVVTTPGVYYGHVKDRAGNISVPCRGTVN